MRTRRVQHAIHHPRPEGHTMSTGNITFYLHVCSSDCCPPAGGTAKVFGSDYPMDFRGKIEVDAKIDKNVLEFSVPEFNVTPKLGSADQIDSVAIRACGKDLTVQAIYKSPEMTAMSACCHGGGCACYASSCWC